MENGLNPLIKMRDTVALMMRIRARGATEETCTYRPTLGIDQDFELPMPLDTYRYTYDSAMT